MTRGWSTLLLLVVAILLGSYIYFVEMRRPDTDAAATEDRVFAGLEAGAISTLTLHASNGDQTIVERDAVGWRITSPIEARADAPEVAGVTSNLTSLDVSRVIDEAPATLAAFGLDAPRLSVGFAGEAGEQTLLLGSRTVTGGDMYAKLAHQSRVFLVPSWLESSFDRTTFQLRDKSLTTFDRTQVEAITVIGRPGTIELDKQDDTWRLRQPLDARADSGAVESLLGRLASGQIKAVVAEQPATLDVYGLAPPRTTVTVSSASGEQLASVLLGSDSDDTAVHARDDARPVVFTVDATLAADLERTANDYRARTLFSAASADLTRVSVSRDGDTSVFERAPAPAGEPGTRGAWQQAAPAATMEPQRIADLVSQLQTVRAERWENRAPAGATAVLAVEFHTTGGTVERVQVLRTADRVFAVRDDEPGAAVLALSSLDQILELLNDDHVPTGDVPTGDDPS